jgi:hypothetical protein
LLSRRENLAELVDTLLERSAERLLFVGDDFGNVRLLGDEFWEYSSKLLNQTRDEFVKETLLRTELLTSEADRSAKDATQHVVAAI